MDFKNIPAKFYPTYAWIWNGALTADEIKTQIDEMYESGIRSFYVIADPERFRPLLRRTHLSPEYLSDEYLDLLYYAFEYATEKGIYTWLYNEGGFPSGMACGKISDLHPDLTNQMLTAEKIVLPAKTPYCALENTLASFVGSRRIFDGETFDKETEVARYFPKFVDNRIHTDISREENTDLFIELTHEALKRKFGEHMGTDIKYMFDDEASMPTWSTGLEVKFREKYGYDLLDYLPYVSWPTICEPTTDAQFRARIDYNMLCYELVRENYFKKMRKWLNGQGMYSVGHLNNEHTPSIARIMRYGNPMGLYREFDIPGIDVIWSQISYPDENGNSCNDMNFPSSQFFPRLAPSAARQMGHSRALTESFAVYGSHVTQDEMRYAVNYQAVRGISLFNFMVISYDRNSVMCQQYRPNFISENLGMDSLSEINGYTARLSYILQSAKADIDTALYLPSRTVCAGEEYEAEACESYERLGNMLEAAGVDFDIIDEELVRDAEISDGALVCKNVTYKNVFVPKGKYELSEVIQKLSAVPSKAEPKYSRTNKKLLARKLIFADGNEAYFLCNTDGVEISDVLTVKSDKYPCEINLFDGELYEIEYERCGDKLEIPVKLIRGEGKMIYLTSEEQTAKKHPKTHLCREYTELSGYVSRIYSLDDNAKPKNTYPEKNSIPAKSGEWDRSFSGEVVYSLDTEGIESGNYMLSLGEVRHYAKVYHNGLKVAEKNLPPYDVFVDNLKAGDELCVAISNTVANTISESGVFDRLDIRDVGPYHSKMIKKEREALPGGLLGPIKLCKIN